MHHEAGEDQVRATRVKGRDGEYVKFPDAVIPGGTIYESDWQQMPVGAREVVRESGLYDVRTNEDVESERRGRRRKSTPSRDSSGGDDSTDQTGQDEAPEAPTPTPEANADTGNAGGNG